MTPVNLIGLVQEEIIMKTGYQIILQHLAPLLRYYCHWPSIFKFKRLMKSTNNKLISKVAKFVYLATRLRG